MLKTRYLSQYEYLVDFFIQIFIQICEICAYVCSHMLIKVIKYVKKESILLYFYAKSTQIKRARRDSNDNTQLYKITFFIHFFIQKIKKDLFRGLICFLDL